MRLALLLVLAFVCASARPALPSRETGVTWLHDLACQSRRALASLYNLALITLHVVFERDPSVYFINRRRLCACSWEQASARQSTQ